MAQSADELLREVALSEPTICSRCFEKSMAGGSQDSLSDGTPCGEDCGQFGVSMEPDPLPTYIVVARGRNLLEIFKRADIDIDSEIFLKAIEKEADDRPPEEVIIRAIEYGIRDRPESDLHVRNEKPEPATTNPYSLRRPEGLAETLAMGPMTKTDFDTYDNASDIEEHVSEFEMPEGYPDIVYLNNPDQFVERFDIDLDEFDVFRGQHDPDAAGDHSEYAVMKIAVQLRQSLLHNESPKDIREWIEDTDDRFSRHILSAAVMVGPPPRHQIPEHDRYRRDSFRDTSVWQLVKKRKSQPIIGFVRNEEPTTIEEIAREKNERESVVRKIVSIEYDTGTLTSTKDGEVYYSHGHK